MLTQRTIRAVELLLIISNGEFSLPDAMTFNDSVEDSLLLQALERGGFIAPLAFVDSVDYKLLSPLSEISLLGLMHAIGEGCDIIESDQMDIEEERCSVGVLKLRAYKHSLRRLLFEIKVSQL